MKNDEILTQANQLCAVDYAFKRIGGKYKARILWYLDMKGVLRYGELNRTLPDITTKMLTQTLRELPPKVEYSLSETGQELIPFIAHLHAWAKKQMEMDTLSVGKVKDERTAAVCRSVCNT